MKIKPVKKDLHQLAGLFEHLITHSNNLKLLELVGLQIDRKMFKDKPISYLCYLLSIFCLAEYIFF